MTNNIILTSKVTGPNSGVIKVNGHNSGWASTSFTAATPQLITATYPLTLSSVTDWPANVTTQSDTLIYDTVNSKWLENQINLQVHIWRAIIFFNRVNTSQPETITFKISNPLSGFEIQSLGGVGKGVAAGEVEMVLVTIADSLSIGVGYELSLETSQDMDLDIDSITIISTRRDNEG